MVSYIDSSSAAHTMPSSDFDLYPSHDESYAGLLQYPAYHFTTFDAQPSIHAFSAPQSNMYAFKHSYLPYSPAASPASGSQSFEVCPPQLSTASDSTVSAQSTSSSAAGSPSMGQQFNEPWSVLGQGLGLEAADSFTSCGFEYEGMVATDKISACVGESLVVSSPSPAARSASQSVSTSKELFKTPTTPASAMISFSPSSPRQANRRSVAAMSANRSRRNSLLSSQMRLSETPAELSAGFVPAHASPVSASPQAPANASSSPMDSSCRFPCSPFFHLSPIARLPLLFASQYLLPLLKRPRTDTQCSQIPH